MGKTEPCLCAAGLPIGIGPCFYCKATENEQCGLLNDLSPREIGENIKAAKRGDEPPHF